jgi:hypothetical protein
VPDFQKCLMCSLQIAYALILSTQSQITQPIHTKSWKSTRVVPLKPNSDSIKDWKMDVKIKKQLNSPAMRPASLVAWRWLSLKYAELWSQLCQPNHWETWKHHQLAFSKPVVTHERHLQLWDRARDLTAPLYVQHFFDNLGSPIDIHSSIVLMQSNSCDHS